MIVSFFRPESVVCSGDQRSKQASKKKMLKDLKKKNPLLLDWQREGWVGWSQNQAFGGVRGVCWCTGHAQYSLYHTQYNQECGCTCMIESVILTEGEC